MIRSATVKDSAKIAEIYNYYISNTIVTFEEDPVGNTEIANRIASTLDEGLPWLVAEENGNVIGYAYASKWKARCAYKFSVESTIYLSDSYASKGWGSKLYAELLKNLKDKKFHVAMGGIALPNPQSIRLHEKFGFQKVAHLKEVGYKFNKWVDVGYWQIKLND